VKLSIVVQSGYFLMFTKFQ